MRYDYLDLTIRWDRQRLWWIVEKDGEVILTEPTSGSLVVDARKIQNRLDTQERR
jgi:hypothetical protein